MLDSPLSATRELFQQVNQLRRQGAYEPALFHLQQALRTSSFSAESLEKAGRTLRGIVSQAELVPAIPDVAVFGQCTTSWLAPTLTAVAWSAGLRLIVGDGHYDNVLQDLQAASASDRRPAALVLLPWTQRLLATAPHRGVTQRLDDELRYWQQAWSLAQRELGGRLIQIGYDWMDTGPLGHHLAACGEGPVAIVRQMNELLRKSLPAGAYFVDLEQISGTMGRERFYDPRNYFWTRQPFSTEGSARLARHISAALRAVFIGPKKVLVMDLDGTLWGGVVGEVGPLGVALGDSPEGEAFRAFQTYVRGLSRRGVLLAVCSKNNPDDARAPFTQHPDMVLRLEDIAHFEASWAPKTEGLRHISESLALGLDSFVFFDDQPAERAIVRQLLPEVEVIEVPADPAEYIRALESALWFESVAVTTEDQQRTAQYQAELQRREWVVPCGTYHDYLRSLEMIGHVRPVSEVDMQRVVQLLAKTNQFNVTTRRHSAANVRQLLELPGATGLTLRMSDRFGDQGMVSLILATPCAHAEAPTLVIDTWLMSCRVIGRSVEQFFFNKFVEWARKQGYRHLWAEYLPTNKNDLVADLYDNLHFARTGTSDGGGVVYALALDGAVAVETFVNPAELPIDAP